MSVPYPERMHDEISLTLTVSEIVALARLVRFKANKLERRQANRPPFVPEPGKRDLTKAQIDRYDALYDKLLDAADIDDLLDPPSG